MAMVCPFDSMLPIGPVIFTHTHLVPNCDLDAFRSLLCNTHTHTHTVGSRSIYSSRSGVSGGSGPSLSRSI